MRRKLTAMVLAGIMVFSLVGCKDKTPKPVADTTAPVITLSSSLPQSGVVGREVSLPTATATDNVDGDISSKVKVTVVQFKADGVTINKELIYEKNATEVQKFTPNSDTLTKYEIIYFVKDAAGNRGEIRGVFNASLDKEAPTLSINTDSVTPAIDLTQGLKAKAAEDIVLPSARGIDAPGDIDISSNIEIGVYYNNNGEKGNRLANYSNASTVKTVRLPVGEYIVEYTLQDGAKNEAQPVSFNLSVGQFDSSKNLLLDRKNVVYDGRVGMPGFNEFGELVIGHISVSDPNMDQALSASLNVVKIYEQIVAVNFNADPAPSIGGQMFYDFIGRGSKDRNTLPNTETGAWPPYLYLRISGGSISPRISSQPDREFSQVKATSKRIIDGQDHTLYFQWLNQGESASDPNAAILLQGWIDQTPDNEPDFIYKVVSGVSTDKGVLQADIFEDLYNETGAGWLSFGSYNNGKTADGKFDDDHMRIKGVAIYDKDATSFDTDISAPTITVDGTINSILPVNEEITLPQATAFDDGVDVSAKIVKKVSINGEDYVVLTGNKYTPTVTGNYRFVYEISDAAGNKNYKVLKTAVRVRDTVAPVLTVDTTAINVNTGEEFTLPTATAIDDVDGDISSQIEINYIGKQYNEYINRNGATTFIPLIDGAHKLVYKVTDSFGNTVTKEVPVNVTGVPSGNILSDNLELAGNAQGITNVYQYDRKVSMLMNVQKYSTLQFLTRGPIGGNADWPQGIVIRLADNGKIDVSAFKHDEAIFGSTNNPYALEYNRNTTTLFEYQVSNVTIEGIEYIRVQVWFQGKALEWAARPDNGGYINLEDGVTAIYRKVSDFTAGQAANIYAGPIWVSAAAGVGRLTISELRIDGTSCDKPEDPQPPQGLAVPQFNSEEAVFNTANITSGMAKIGSYSNEDTIQITFKATNTETASQTFMAFNVMGGTNEDNPDGWNGGIMFLLGAGGAKLVTGSWDNPIATFSNWNPYATVNDTTYVLRYKFTYVITNELVTALKLDVWFGTDEASLTKAEWTQLVSGVTYEDETLVLSYTVLDTDKITPNAIRVQNIPVSQTGVEVLEIKKVI
ncbi:MAG TPA: hypothetical protein VIL26_04850 [Clostridia bacterium]